MNKLLLCLSVLLCLLHAQSIAQKPGAERWRFFNGPKPRADTIHSIKVQPDGKIVAAGNSYQGANLNDWYMLIAVGRYVDGIPDANFGTNGMVVTLLDSAHASANAVELQQDGKIVVAGGYKKGSAGDFILVRYDQDGRVDSSFGTNGIVLTDIGSGSFDVATALVIQTDGKIVAAGRSDGLLALCRYNTDGSPDSSFDSDGKVLVDEAGATCMKLQADGKIVVCCGYVVFRLHPDGSLDSSYGINGMAQFTNYFYDMAIQKDGKILVAGGNDNQFVLERLDTTGIHDNSFGNGGVVTTTGFSSSDRGRGATCVCLQADGRILAAGYVKPSTLSTLYKDFAVARYKSNGALDSSFGVLGKLDRYIGYETATPFSAAINNNGELLLAGTSNTQGYLPSGWAMMCIYLSPMLAVHTVPGGDRQIIVAPNPAEEFARIQSTHIDNGSWHLSLCDLTGRLLYSEMVAVSGNALDKSIALTGLPAAMYLVKLENGSNRMAVMLTKSR